ncbi:MAG: ArnT family glycosyltransferase [Fimbriimonas sp.]
MSNRNRWILTWAAALLPLLGWWMTGLFDLDEGFYGAVVAEMNRRGEWITPYYNGSPWFEKPILLYWLGKPSVALLGDMAGPRLPSVLANIGIYALTVWFCRRRFSESVAQLALLILGSSFLMVVLGRMMMTDSPLALCLLAAWITLWESLDGDKRWRWLSGLAIGIGVLAKGPVALILFALVMLWMFARHPSVRPKMRGGWVGFWLLCMASLCSWYVPAYLASGETFVQKFLIDQNIGRFVGGDAAHTLGGFASLVLYIPVLFLGMLPWSVWVPKSLLVRTSELESYLATCAVAVFLFFTIGGAKLPHYILPCLPPLAILVASRLHQRTWTYNFGLAWCVVVALAANLIQGWYYAASGQREAHALARYIRANAAFDEVALFQLGRREKELGTGTLNVQETSLPSMMLYLNRATLDTDDFQRILGSQRKVWLFTRSGRIRPEHYALALEAGKRLDRVYVGGMDLKNFELYVVR